MSLFSRNERRYLVSTATLGAFLLGRRGYQSSEHRKASDRVSNTMGYALAGAVSGPMIPFYVFGLAFLFSINQLDGMLETPTRIKRKDD